MDAFIELVILPNPLPQLYSLHNSLFQLNEECHRYHIPREWLQASNNLLVIFEETGGNPLFISLKVHSTETICGHVSENDYPPLSTWFNPNLINNKNAINSVAPEMLLKCDDNHIISDITFASYGTPTSSQSFSLGKCHSESSLSLVTEVRVFLLLVLELSLLRIETNHLFTV